MADTGMVVGLIKALVGTPDPAVITEAVNDWLDDHPEATTTVEDGAITEAKLDNNLKGVVADVGDLKTAIGYLEPAATSDDIGKALIAKTVSGGKVTEYEFGDASVDPSDIAAAVDDWLDDHPEATTTVQDGSITKEKLSTALQYKVNEFNTYYAELDRWEIPNDGTDATATTANINSMIVWAKTNGYNAVALPAGTYLIDAVNDNYTGAEKRTDAGIIMRDDMALIMRSDTILQVATNDSEAYACITFHDKPKNVMIKGGKIIGDRLTHDFTGDGGGTHEFGHGIFSQGVENLIIDGVYIDGCTGDGIALSSVGMTTTSTGYFPTKNAKVLNCTVKNSRRNNISVTGAEDIVIAGCHIIGAGTEDANHDGTAPRFGIDVEGYGEGAVDYTVTRRIFVLYNIFEGNVNASCDFLTGYECCAIGNVSDGMISYGSGNNIVIADNVFYKNPATRTGQAAILGSAVSNGFDGSYVTITGNQINGFAQGMELRGSKILVFGNNISNAVKGIGMYTCSECTVIANRIEKFIRLEGESGERYGMTIDSSSDIIVKANTFMNGTYGYAIRISSTLSASATSNISIMDNTFYNIDDGVNIMAGSNCKIIGNQFNGSRDAVFVYADVANTVIENNTFENVTRTDIRSTLGNTAGNVVLINNNTFKITNESAVYFTKNACTNIIKNTIICAPTQNNKDAVYVASTPIENTVMNRFIENVVVSVGSINMRYAITAPNGGSQFIGNRIYTGTINHHADDTMTNNYPAS